MPVKLIFYLLLICVVICIFIGYAGVGLSISKEDTRSLTLLTKAWDALAANNLEDVIYYTSRCIELYEPMARKQQAILRDLIKGPKEDILFYWQLNDVATAYFIQAEAYRKAGITKKAINVYEKIIKDYKYAQCWIKDGEGGFWRPAERSFERLLQLAHGEHIE